jgi:hypothetical protein
VPAAGKHLWDWYFDIDARVSRIGDDVCKRIPPSEWLAWATLTGHVVYSWEYDILAAMDAAYCAGVNGEIAAGRALQEKPNG